MISISDNTATDHLIHRLGRRAVEAQLGRFGMARPLANTPFLTTRELFVLKGGPDRSLIRRYLDLGRPARRRFLVRRVDPLPVTAVKLWKAPRATDTVEYFASANDLCRAYARLGRQARRSARYARALSLSDGGLALPSSRWPSVWFKGGSEPGVFTVAYRLRARRPHLRRGRAGQRPPAGHPGVRRQHGDARAGSRSRGAVAPVAERGGPALGRH